MDKTFLVQQLAARLRAAAAAALRIAEETRTEAKTGAARAVNLAKGSMKHSLIALAARDAVETFKAPPLCKDEPIRLGAVVEIENAAGGRSLFLAPAGAGEELTGPHGDGFFVVVTPISPVGRALLGKRVGDVVETVANGEATEWTITYAT